MANRSSLGVRSSHKILLHYVHVSVTDHSLLMLRHCSFNLETRTPLDKSVSERLLRVWQERGDFTHVTAASIKREAEKQTQQGAENNDESEARLRDDRPTAAEMKELQAGLMEQLA